MKAYIGTKIIQAELSPPTPAMIEKGHEPHEVGYKVEYEDGYESWSPKDVFERCYREITNAEADLMMGGDAGLAGIDLDKPNYEKG